MQTLGVCANSKQKQKDRGCSQTGSERMLVLAEILSIFVPPPKHMCLNTTPHLVVIVGDAALVHGHPLVCNELCDLCIQDILVLQPT